MLVRLSLLMFNVDIRILTKCCLAGKCYLLSEHCLSFIHKWLSYLYLQLRSFILNSKGFFLVTKSTWKLHRQVKHGMSKWTYAHPTTYLIYWISCLNKWHHHLLFMSETWKSTVTPPHPSSPTQSPSPVESTTTDTSKNFSMAPFNHPSSHFPSKPSVMG